MPKFITIGYGDREGYERIPETVRDAAHAHDERLRRDGVTMGIAGRPIQVRNHSGERVETTAGAFMQASLPVAGFALIEATDLDEAVRIASCSPCAVAHGVIEVWPLEIAPAS